MEWHSQVDWLNQEGVDLDETLEKGRCVFAAPLRHHRFLERKGRGGERTRREVDRDARKDL